MDQEGRSIAGQDKGVFDPPQPAAESVFGSTEDALQGAATSRTSGQKWHSEAAGTEIDFPPVVYVPCVQSEDGKEAAPDLRQMRDGRHALIVYSALDRLVRCAGQQQPWVVVPAAKLDELDQQTPFDVILLDVLIPPEHRRYG